MHAQNSFLTLTYRRGDALNLVPGDLRDFWKRLRKRVGPVRYFSCGEYGELNSRAHYHACVFGLDFTDKVYYRKSPSGSRLYTSALLDSVWQHGFCTVGEVTFESAAYVARYVMKKEFGKDVGPKRELLDVTTGEIVTREHEFCRMSLKPGLGYSWLQKYTSDVYPSGQVVVNGAECSSPRYYDKWYKAVAPEKYAALAARRVAEADLRFDDNSPRRLKDKAIVLNARVSLLKRELV